MDARHADIIITMVPGTPDVERVLFGERGVALGLTAGKIVVDMSSVSPGDTKVFATRINGLGCGYLDAPVSGGEVGTNGAGQTANVANQIGVALTIEVVAEALLFASRAGVDPARVRAALMGGFTGSKIMEIHGERMITRTFEPGARIELHLKDLNLALSGARALGLNLPNTAATQELFNACVASGWSGLDHSALVKALEKLADHTVAPD